MTSRADEILDAAERLVRRIGYAAMSTRAVAEEVGIRAASLHHHFPTKSDLGRALTERYTERFLTSLGTPEDARMHPDGALGFYCAAFMNSFKRDGALCLCGVLGAEIQGLPSSVAEGARAFFQRNLNWLTEALRRPDQPPSPARAMRVLSALEGGMVLSVVLDDASVLVAVCEDLKRTEGI